MSSARDNAARALSPPSSTKRAAREAAAHDTGAPPVPVPVPVAAAPLEVETIAIAEGRPVHLDVPVGSEVHTG